MSMYKNISQVQPIADHSELDLISSVLHTRGPAYSLAGGMLGHHRAEDNDASPSTAEKILMQALYLTEGVQGAISSTTARHLVRDVLQGKDISISTCSHEHAHNVSALKSVIRQSLLPSLKRALSLPLVGMAVDPMVPTPPLAETLTGATLMLREFAYMKDAVRVLLRRDLDIDFQQDQHLHEFEAVLHASGEGVARTFLDDVDGILGNDSYLPEYVGIAEQLCLPHEGAATRFTKVFSPLWKKMLSYMQPKNLQREEVYA